MSLEAVDVEQIDRGLTRDQDVFGVYVADDQAVFMYRGDGSRDVGRDVDQKRPRRFRELLQPALGTVQRVNFFGQAGTLDRQGRIVIPQPLRDSAAMAGEVSVLGQHNYVAVWNLKRLQDRFKKEPFSDEDGRLLGARQLRQAFAELL